jgi:nicotinamidase-related amidase
MPINLAELVQPRATAILSMEMQRGVVGDLSTLPALAELVAKTAMPARLAALMAAGRRAGAQVVFCNIVRRPDGKGSGVNAPLLARMAKQTGRQEEGSPTAQVIPELPVLAEDLVSTRYHGMSPFTGTSLDAWLRNLGIKTVIATGVSLNIGVIGMAIEAIGFGYSVVLARDCAIGVPTEYGEAVIKNSLALLGAVATSEEIIAAWR